MTDNLFDVFTQKVLYPGAEKIVNATADKVSAKIVGVSSGQNNNVNNTVSAVAPSGASSVARSINDALSGIAGGGSSLVIPLVLLAAVAGYLIIRK